MSATKEIKELLQRVRQQLDPESQANVEPILREVLDHAKPKTLTQVEYRSDPRDQAALAALQAKIAERDDAIRKLEFKLAAQQLRDGMSFDELLDALHKRGSAMHVCFCRCLVAAKTNERRRRAALMKSLAGWQVALATYLKGFAVCNAIDGNKLNKIIGASIFDGLQKIKSDVHAETGAMIDFKISFGKRPS